MIPASLYMPLLQPVQECEDINEDELHMVTCAARGSAVWARGVHLA